MPGDRWRDLAAQQGGLAWLRGTCRRVPLWAALMMPEEEMPPAKPGPVTVRTFEGPSRWDLFDPEGRWLCTVEMPGSFTPLEIGADHVAGVWRDTDDVEHVRLYRLIKP